MRPRAFASLRSILLSAAVAVTAGAAAAAPPPSDRPDILLLVTDDQRWDCLGTNGHPLLKTPHIDRLAAEGVSFRDAFVTTSICFASRAGLYTGRHARTLRLPDFSSPLPPEALAAAFPAVLKKAGYRTGCVGKWGVGGDPPREMFDFWDAWGGQGEFFHDVDGRKVHNSEYLALRAEEFIRGTPPDRPFCLVVLYKSPHEPFLPDPRDAGLFADAAIPVPRTYSEAHWRKMAPFVRDSEGRTRLNRRHPTPESYPEFVKQYLRCVAGVDRSVGKILAVLDDLKRSDRTVALFTSDNGFFLGEHGMSGKWLMYEESIRVPLIVRDPRLPAARRGARPEAMALNIDVAPTLLELAGAAVPAGTEGRSLAPILRGEHVPWRADFFYEHHYHAGGRIPRTEGVRAADWKYIVYLDAGPLVEELYDLKSDPMEERDLAGDPAHRERLEALRRRYRECLASLPPAAVPQPPPPSRQGR